MHRTSDDPETDDKLMVGSGWKNSETANIAFSGGRLNTHELHATVSNQKNSEGARWIRLDTGPNPKRGFSGPTGFVGETASDVDASHAAHVYMSRK